MRLGRLAASLLLLAFGIGNQVHAGPYEYYPPERIDCKLADGNHFRCEGFNREILQEDITNADMQSNKEDTFYFVYGLAYFAPNQKTATVFYHYNNHKFRMVRLKTFNSQLHPDITHGTWKKFREGIYVCDNGYLACSITDRQIPTS